MIRLDVVCIELTFMYKKSQGNDKNLLPLPRSARSEGRPLGNWEIDPEPCSYLSKGTSLTFTGHQYSTLHMNSLITLPTFAWGIRCTLQRYTRVLLASGIRLYPHRVQCREVFTSLASNVDM